MKRILSLVPMLLVLAAIPAAAQSAARPLTVGQTVSSELDASDSKLEDGSYSETWTFQARAGQRLVISMGGEFDTYLVLGYMDGGEFRQISEGDDALFSTDSSIDFNVRRDGTYVIRTRSFSEGETGKYTLVVFDGT
jgi:hypothetical protein